MKKACFAALALLVIFMVMSCGGSPKATKEPERMSGLPDIVRNARKNAPEGVIIGIGQASAPNQASQQQARDIAETRARAEISRVMSTMVQQMISDYRASSEPDPDAVLSFQENITVALSKSNLVGAAISDEDLVNGMYYVVVYLSKADTVREIASAQEAARRLAPAAMASFNAQDRMEDMFARQLNEDPQVRDRD